jgi:hypothetical protein
MQKPDFWTAWADAMELSIQGNRLIARDIGELARDLWRRLGRALSAMVHIERRHRPPV